MIENSAPPAASPAARVVAFLVGLLVGLAALLVSLGTVLFSFASMGIASWMRRRRGRSLTPMASWVASIAGIAVVMLLGVGVTWSLMPKGAWQEAKRSMDSTSANTPPTPPPAWLERLAPGSTQRAAQMNGKPSESMQAGMLIWGSAALVLMLSGFIGSLGWVSGMLFGFATNGRWPGAQPPEAIVAPAV
jgi:hypothetical protein